MPAKRQISLQAKKQAMAKLGPLDLELIMLGIAKDAFDENDIAESRLKRLGVGRTLDLLASLKEKKMVCLNGDGSFSVTDQARHILWDDAVPAKARVLRLLEIRPCSDREMSDILGMSLQDATDTADGLRRDGLVLMSPMRQDQMLVKMYELLPDGIEAAADIEKGGAARGTIAGKDGILETLDQIIRDFESEPAGTASIADRLRALRKALESASM